MSTHYNLRIAGAALFLTVAVALAGASSAHAATTCTFATDLSVGADSAAVKCLQQYLNVNGFTVAATGVGSMGHETTQFKEKTMAAVKEWQVANGISPATGTFGPKSRAKYVALTTATVPVPTPTPAPVPTPTPTPVPTPTPTVNDTERQSARKAIQSARDDYEDASNDYEDAHDDGDDTGKAKTYLADAEEAILKALYAYVDEDYDTALDSAKDAQSSIDDASDDIGGSKGGDQSDARDAIKETKKDLDDAWDDVDDASGSTSKAEKYLDDAQEKISDAEDSYDDKDYDDVLDLIDDAKNYIDKALDAI